MPDPTPKPTRPAVFIEKIFPVTLLNKQVYYEHGGNPFKGLHRWYSRKPLSFSRASVLGSLLPDTVTMEEFEYLLGLNRRVDGHSDGMTKLYKTPPSPERIKQVHDLCEQTWGTRTPTVLDAFAGGGSIPFEAVRYGLNVLASDLNPVAVVTMKAAMEYPLKFGSDLQHEIDKWVKWVGDEAEKRLAEFFPSQEGETVQNYLWAHTVVCPSCESVVPLSPSWWLSKTSNYAGLGQARKVTGDWCAVKPIANPKEKRVDFELIKGRKGKGATIVTELGEEYDPQEFATLSRATGKCLNCGNIIENDAIKSQGSSRGLGHQCYAVAFKKGKSGLMFRTPIPIDLDGIKKAEIFIDENEDNLRLSGYLPKIELAYAHETHERQSLPEYGLRFWSDFFNPRQRLVLSKYVEVILDIKKRLSSTKEPHEIESVLIYLTLVLDKCVDENNRLTHWNSARCGSEGASAQHSMNLMWNYTEICGISKLWHYQASSVTSDYSKLCKFSGIADRSHIPGLNSTLEKTVQIYVSSADNQLTLSDGSADFIVTDPPYGHLEKY